MEFNYVVGWYSRKGMTPLGGFLDIKSAKAFADMTDTLFFGEGFLYIDSPEGKYINGYEKYSDVTPKWFTPEEVNKKDIRVYVYSCHKDRNVLLDDFLPYDDYKRFTETGNLFQTAHKKGEMMISNTLKAGDMVKVHLYDTDRNEIKTNIHDKAFTVHEKDGKLGIDWKDNKFASFDTFASSANFENVETGQTYYYNTISGKVEKTVDAVKRESVIGKLSDNKKIVESRDTESKDSQQERTKQQHEHENNER